MMLLVVAGCAGEQIQSVPEPTVQILATPTLEAAPTATQAYTTYVQINEFKYTPNSVNIKVGDTVRWIQLDEEDHTVTTADLILDSPILPQGEEWSFTFEQPGTYEYHCNFHPGMIGRVIVE